LPKIMSRLNTRYLSERGIVDATVTGEGLVSLLRKAIPYTLQTTLAELLGERIQDWVVNRSTFGGCDWSRTPAFSVSTEGTGYLRLNIKRREAHGFFEPESKELDHYVDWLEDALLSIRVVGTNELLIKSVSRTRNLFPGQRSHLLPDLILHWSPHAPVENIVSDEIGEIHERLRTGRGGNHTGETFIVVAGQCSSSAVHQIADVSDVGRFVHSCFTPSSKRPD
jgi:predicted AlkP superfamily phosphohydrolase/phosphomutase